MMLLRRLVDVLLSMTLFLASGVEARSVMVANEKVVHADAVYDVEIMQRSPQVHASRNCGVTYEAKVLRAIKGKVAGPVLTFGFLDGLEVGHSYTVYLASSRNRQLMQGLLKSRMMSDAEAGAFIQSCPEWDYYFFKSKKSTGRD
ncbi:hypothetical protein ACQ4WQ_07640 [Janthinobacterium sp. GB1R12]|uniref:hypothetical protein n=1 Tax=Janthinobacterium sp. GB1R12 TaxID=3424190 RepID=UPI003F219667